jgi:nucleoside-diphosphate-sugar epimerase
LADCSKPELFGEPITEDLEYGDESTLGAITSFPIDGHPHRDVDVIVLAAPSNVNTAIVCPPCIYGTGTGSGNTKSIQVPLLINRFLKRKRGFTVQRGKSEWNNVHVCDLAEVYLKLTEAAVAGGKNAEWNDKGYYFAENGRHTWEDLSKEIAQKCKDMKLLPTDEIDYLDNKDILELHPFGHVAWGTNSIGKAERARKLLGWTPGRESLSDTLVESIKVEAKALGLSF